MDGGLLHNVSTDTDTYTKSDTIVVFLVKRRETITT